MRKKTQENKNHSAHEPRPSAHHLETEERNEKQVDHVSQYVALVRLLTPATLVQIYNPLIPHQIISGHVNTRVNCGVYQTKLDQSHGN